VLTAFTINKNDKSNLEKCQMLPQKTIRIIIQWQKSNNCKTSFSFGTDVCTFTGANPQKKHVGIWEALLTLVAESPEDFVREFPCGDGFIVSALTTDYPLVN
jgi:hypothetical protein